MAARMELYLVKKEYYVCLCVLVVSAPRFKWRSIQCRETGKYSHQARAIPRVSYIYLLDTLEKFSVFSFSISCVFSCFVSVFFLRFAFLPHELAQILYEKFQNDDAKC